MQPMLFQDYETDLFDVKAALDRLNDLEKHAHGDFELGPNGPIWKGSKRITRLFVDPSKITLYQSENDGRSNLNHRFEIAGSNKTKIDDELKGREMLEFTIEQIKTALNLQTGLQMGRHSDPNALDIIETGNALANAAETVIRHINPEWNSRQSVEVFLPGLEYPGRIASVHGKKKLFSAPLEKAILAKLKPALKFQVNGTCREIVPVSITSSSPGTPDPMQALEAWKVIGFDPGRDSFLKAALKPHK